MKKILLSAILVFGAIAANAQRTSIGITAGAGTAWMTNTGEDVMYSPAWNAGATFVYSSETHWGFGADVKYSREGVRYNYRDVVFFGSQDLKDHISTDYIRVPLRVIYFFNKNDHAVRPNISVGPSFGFLTGGHVRTLHGDDVLTKGPAKDDFKPFDFGVQGTIGASFQLADAVWLSADVAYYQGLIQQNKNGSEKMMNANLGLNLGLRFGIGN